MDLPKGQLMFFYNILVPVWLDWTSVLPYVLVEYKNPQL